MVLHFKSIHNCTDFCDRLTYLNQEYLAPPWDDDVEDTTAKKMARSPADHIDGYVNGMGKREVHRDEIRNDK